MQNSLQADEIDLKNRTQSCQINRNPFLFPLFYSRFSFRPDQEIIVIRDDMFCGGTKSRVAYSLIQKLSKYWKEFVYISPWYGGGQIALAWIIRQMKSLKATIILSKTNEIGDVLKEMSPFTKIAQKLGAQILICQDNTKKFANDYLQSKSNAILLRSGFDYKIVRKNIANLAQNIVTHLGPFDECWCAAGSGTLIRGLQESKILAKKYFAVCVFQECPPIGRAQEVIPSIPFSVPVSESPPFPSALRYDAKVWKYIQNRPGRILFWNVM